MKRVISVIVLVFCISMFSIANAQIQMGEGTTNFALVVSGGLGYAKNSSMDDAVSWYGNDAATALNILNGTTVFYGDNDKAGFAAMADLEGRLFLGNIGFGLGIGYQSGGKSKSAAKADGYQSEQSLTLKLEAISYLGTMYYRSILSENSFLTFGAGIGYYNATMTVIEEASGFMSGNFKYEYEFTGSAWGGHASIEYNYLYGNIDIFGGALIRYANVKEFKRNGNALTYNNYKVEGNFTGIVFYIGAGFMI
jgi:hypothetical protein